MRTFKNREIELLAPCNNFKQYKEIVKTKCDAIFLGGETLNMRTFRNGFDFTNYELMEVMQLAKSNNKKIYISLNSLLNENSLDEAKEFLLFLNEIKPDAVIVQDLAIIALIEELGIDINLHSSVLLNANDKETVRFLQDVGIEKIVMSREATLEDIKTYKDETGIDIEYFAHGDMCFASGSQCTGSSAIFGKSARCGRCLKVCRWQMNVEGNNTISDLNYPISVKDLSIYEYIEELFDAGVTTFKIEGRMRELSFLIPLINYYGEAFDKLCETGNYDKSMEFLYENKIRELSAGFIHGNPQLSYISKNDESKLKALSNPTEMKEVTNELAYELNELIDTELEEEEKQLSVYVKDIENLKLCIKNDIDIIYLSMEFLHIEMKVLKNIDKKNSKVYLALPRKMTDKHYIDAMYFMKHNYFDGILATTLGALNYFDDYKVVIDTNLSMYNSKAVEFINKKREIEFCCLSTELLQNEFDDIIKNSKNNMEIIVHGIIPIMYSKLNLYNNVPKGDNSTVYLRSNEINLQVVKDDFDMCHILPNKEFCMKEIVQNLKKYKNIKVLRIDGRFYNSQELQTILNVYKTINEKNINSVYETVRDGLTLGALSFKSN